MLGFLFPTLWCVCFGVWAPESLDGCERDSSVEMIMNNYWQIRNMYFPTALISGNFTLIDKEHSFRTRYLEHNGRRHNPNRQQQQICCSIEKTNIAFAS